MRTKLLLVLTSIICLFAFEANAQVTTASINGTVMDESGETLIGATVVALHEPSGVSYGTTTRNDGRFNLPNLKIGGPYSVTVSYVGFANAVESGINLTIGQKLRLDFNMSAAGVDLAEFTVTGAKDDIFDSERTGAATSIGTRELTRLPTISRSASDFTRLTPASDGNSFGGRNDQFNNFSLDGSIFNNPFGLDAATPGGQTDAQPVSLDAIEQIQVSLAPYDVTQAGFTGASVNAVTKSGTNKFSGTVYGFGRNESMTGSKVSGNDVFVADLQQVQFGTSLGGALVKDKVFFFVNYEQDNRTDLGSNFLANRGESGPGISRVLASDLDAVSSALMDRYGYETGDYENFYHSTNSQKALAKLDFNLSNSSSLTLTYNWLDASKDKPAHPSALGRRGPDATTLQFANSGYTINNVIHSVIAEWRTLIGNSAANNLKVGYTAFRDTRDPMSAPFPVLNINQDGIRYIVAGHEPFSINNRLSQDVFQITNNFNIYKGDHTITIGASLERFDFDNSFNLGVYDFGFPGGTFGPGYESVGAFLDSLNNGSVDPYVEGALATFNGNNENETWALAETNVGQGALYIQDEWAMSSDFTLTYGLRVDMPLYFDTPTKVQENIDRAGFDYNPDIVYYNESGEEVTFDHTVLPSQTPLISPRVGFNYDAGGTGTMQVRGGTGLFSGRLPFVWIGNQVANPNWWFYCVTNPDFKYPQVWRSNLGIDKKLDNGWVVTTDIIYTKDINGMMVRNYGLKAPTATLAGVDNRPIYGAGDVNAGPFGSFPNNAYVFTNTNVGSSFNWTLSAKKDFDNGMSASLAYNFLDSKDASSIEAEISSDAYDRNPAYGNVNEAVLSPSLYGNRHRVIGTLMHRIEYGKMATSIALFMEYAQGGRFSYTYSGNINGDGSGLNDLIYIPTESELGQMNFSSEEGRAAYEAFIQQDEYLSANRGSVMEKYGILSPWYSRWDLRILQDLMVSDDNMLQLSIDVLNIGNMVNSSWGVRQLPTNTQPVGVSVTDGVPTYSFDPALTSSFTDDFSLMSRWQMQIGLRYRF